MNSFKTTLFIELRKHHDGYKDLSDEEIDKILFYKIDSLRLTMNGFICIKKIFTAYSFQVPDTMKTKHFKALTKMTYPYYLTSKRLILFSEMDAMVVEIQGSIERFLEVCSQN